MQKIKDLQEILTAIQDIGSAWQKENIKLCEDNDYLFDENQHLRETCENLTKQNNSLRQEINNLSEKTEQLIKNLRDELIKELAADKQEEFQKFVRDYLKELRKASSKPITNPEEPTSPQNERPY